MIDADGAVSARTTMRADARRNRDLILAAARDVFVEHGSDAPLEAIAARAGVGIGTLYRRFPGREHLMREVVRDALHKIGEEGRQALAEEPDAFRALARYLHRALDLHVSAVIPALLDRVSLEDEEMRRLRAWTSAPMQEMIDRAQAEGTLRPDVTFGDVGLLLVRLARPLPGPFPRPLGDALAHRHLALLLDALRAGGHAAADPLPGPALSLADLQEAAASVPPDLVRERRAS